VDQSTDTPATPRDQVHGSPSDIGSGCDDDDDVTAHSSDSSSRCLVNVNPASAATSPAAEPDDGQRSQ